MQFVWEPKDITGGLVVRSGNLTEHWMVCYIYDNKENKYQLVSLRDGVIQNNFFMTQVETADFLNRTKMIPAVKLGQTCIQNILDPKFNT